jgi:hypothetical protein
MHKLLLAMAVLGTVTSLMAFGASAAPAISGIRTSSSQPLMTHVDWHRHYGHWSHRRWWHGYWRYW